MKTDERFASATIKFLDLDIRSGRSEFMVGSKNITLDWKQSQMFREGGVVKAGIIAELMGISGRLV